MAGRSLYCTVATTHLPPFGCLAEFTAWANDTHALEHQALSWSLRNSGRPVFGVKRHEFLQIATVEATLKYSKRQVCY